jgi:ferrous iron transport protein A
MSASSSLIPAAMPETRERARVIGRSAHEGSLDSLELGQEGRVVSIVLDRDLAAWVAAVGIREGERLTVLRRAAFGGPIHVRTVAGGEFALARSLARAILVRPGDSSP